MKRPLLYILILLIAYTSVAQTQEIDSTLDEWHKAAAEADFKSYFELMAKDAVFVGSDAAEVWEFSEFKAFSKPYFDAGKAWTFTPVNRTVYTNGDMAWFDEVLTSDHMGLCRGSGVLILNKKGEWKIQHFVLSLAVPNSLVSELVKDKSELDKKYLETQL